MYYVLEMEMPQVLIDRLKEAAVKEHLSIDEFFDKCIKYHISHPEEIEKFKKEYDEMSFEDKFLYDEVKIVREYPVNDGESEYLARMRCLKEERSLNENHDRLPRIASEEFINHIEDDDFFLKYGNPVLIEDERGDLVAMNVEYYERIKIG
ncbi:MAG: hypothetical protein IK151_04325 [Erysipelotrichaceae bacterium]|nr:hypothetical protein [Erysipelotrichaceae bacterium]